ncbi:hypothetical protein C8R46DRAFT_1193716 [Mycena filopes]|nr:hypothetical protein C8R46DRAFT_1193716 [Mycena filopes]
MVPERFKQQLPPCSCFHPLAANLYHALMVAIQHHFAFILSLCLVASAIPAVKDMRPQRSSPVSASPPAGVPRSLTRAHTSYTDDVDLSELLAKILLRPPKPATSPLSDEDLFKRATAAPPAASAISVPAPAAPAQRAAPSPKIYEDASTPDLSEGAVPSTHKHAPPGVPSVMLPAGKATLPMDERDETDSDQLIEALPPMTVVRRADDTPEPLEHPTIHCEQFFRDVAAPVEDPVNTADSSEPKDGQQTTDSDAGGGVIDEHKQMNSGRALACTSC